jgi:hypothetical protein
MGKWFRNAKNARGRAARRRHVKRKNLAVLSFGWLDGTK